ncbi:MAG: hypothetical protein ABWY56_07260, partial [Propionibacteriaceae bacterium]
MTPRVRSILVGVAVLVVGVFALLVGGGLDEQTANPAPSASVSRSAQPARDSESGLPLVELKSLPAQ